MAPAGRVSGCQPRNCFIPSRRKQAGGTGHWQSDSATRTWRHWQAGLSESRSPAAVALIIMSQGHSSTELISESCRGPVPGTDPRQLAKPLKSESRRSSDWVTSPSPSPSWPLPVWPGGRGRRRAPVRAVGSGPAAPPAPAAHWLGARPTAARPGPAQPGESSLVNGHQRRWSACQCHGARIMIHVKVCRRWLGTGTRPGRGGGAALPSRQGYWAALAVAAQRRRRGHAARRMPGLPVPLWWPTAPAPVASQVGPPGLAWPLQRARPARALAQGDPAVPRAPALAPQ